MLRHELAQAYAFRDAAILWIVEAGIGNLQAGDRRRDGRQLRGEAGRSYGLSITKPPDVDRN